MKGDEVFAQAAREAARFEAAQVIQRALELDPGDERAKILRERIQGDR